MKVLQCKLSKKIKNNTYEIGSDHNINSNDNTFIASCMRCWKNRNWITTILVIEDHFCMFIPTHYICFLSMRYCQQWTIVLSHLAKHLFLVWFSSESLLHTLYTIMLKLFVSNIFKIFRRSVTDFRKMKKLFYALLFSPKCSIKFNLLPWLIENKTIGCDKNTLLTK